MGKVRAALLYSCAIALVLAVNEHLDAVLNKAPEDRSLEEWQALPLDTLRLIASAANISPNPNIAQALFDELHKDSEDGSASTAASPEHEEIPDTENADTPVEAELITNNTEGSRQRSVRKKTYTNTLQSSTAKKPRNGQKKG